MKNIQESMAELAQKWASEAAQLNEGSCGAEELERRDVLYRCAAELKQAFAEDAAASGERQKTTEEKLALHQYRCPLDGEQLVEIGLGTLMCRRCETQFVPTLGPSDGEAGLSWMLNAAQAPKSLDAVCSTMRNVPKKGERR